MSTATVELNGYAEAIRVLETLDLEVRGRELKRALRNAGKIVADRARQLVPQPGYPGDKPEYKPLRDTIEVVVKEGETIYAVVGPGRPAGTHGHLVERGTKPHEIKVKNKRVMAKNTVASSIFGQLVKHRGTTPHPFLGPAAEETKARQEAALVQGLQQAAERAAKRG